ncbi:hypothetical protein F4778DRAFT_703785 [Xylariomycetidae sp. FL2044]|nr:hypothetical protein F4778DRAFT_703785 [Xylariomycetidae sp. FL2044]
MKKFKPMAKVLGSMRRSNDAGPVPSVDTTGESPEAIAARSVKAFCESSGPNNAGDEVLFLPPIVDAAESSPAAAAECAYLIRKYLKRDYWTKPSYQYNALMLVRILADNPGPTFTRNLDQKFADTAKDLLRSVNDPSVRQMMMETLDSFETTKAYDEGLTIVIEMWKKEKEKARKAYGGRTPPSQPPLPNRPHNFNAQPPNPHSQNYFARNHNNRRLPSPVELASRLEEARTSAQVLQQVVTNTPPAEVLSNDLIKEFADRCLSASRSIQNYMTASDPAPDNDTMESLIETNDQLQAALSLHQRSMLNARKHVAQNSNQTDDRAVSPMEDSDQNGLGIQFTSSQTPPTPPRKANGKGKAREYEPSAAGPSRTHTPAAPEEDPFRDPDPPEASGSSSHAGAAAGGSSSTGTGAADTYQLMSSEPRLAFEPFHPGGFSTTDSYLGRQESAVGKEAMQGANVTTRRSSAADDASSDLYEATPTKEKSKEPVYRY